MSKEKTGSGIFDFFTQAMNAPELAMLLPMMNFYMSNHKDFSRVGSVRDHIMIYVSSLRRAAVEAGDLTAEEASKAGLIQLISVALTGIKKRWDVHEFQQAEARSRAGGNPDFVNVDTGYFADSEDDSDDEDDTIDVPFTEIR